MVLSSIRIMILKYKISCIFIYFISRLINDLSLSHLSHHFSAKKFSFKNSIKKLINTLFIIILPHILYSCRACTERNGIMCFGYDYIPNFLNKLDKRSLLFNLKSIGKIVNTIKFCLI